MAEELQNPQKQALVAWLAESEKLQVFFSRVLTEAREQRVDRIQFTIDGDALLGSLRRSGSELKTLSVKAAWFEPMARWLFDRSAYAWSTDSALSLRFPQEQMEAAFPVLLRVSPEYVRCRVSQRLVLNRKHVLALSDIEYCSVDSIFEQLELGTQQASELRELIEGAPTFFVVGGPDDLQTQRVRATYLSLLGAQAAGLAADVLTFSSIQDLVRNQHLVLTRTASDAWTLAQHYMSQPHFEQLAAIILTGFVPRVCPSCKRETAIPGSLLAELPEGLVRRIGTRYSLGSGCAECGQSGNLGLCGVNSILLLGESRRAALSEADGLRRLHQERVLPLLEDGVEKVAAGKITPAQLLALAKSVPSAYLSIINDFKQTSTQAGSSERTLTLSADVFKGAQSTPAVLSGRAAFTGSASDAQADGPLFTLGASGKVREKPLVLVVEDDPDQRSILEVLLRSSGYEVQSAANGREGLEQVQRELPDVIVTDLMMPQMDGAELISRVRADTHARRVPILVLTVLSDSEKEYALLNVGADDYCEKTIQRKVLLKRIEKLARRGRE